MQAYNSPRDSADLEKVYIYSAMPDYIHADFAPKSFGILAKEAEKYADRTLSEAEWKGNEVEQKRWPRDCDSYSVFSRGS